MQPIYGIISDKIGRKPVILLPMFGVLFMCTSLLLVDYNVFGLWVMMVQALISGLLGSYFVLITALMAYFADTTEAHERSHVFVVGESVIFVGFAIGPFLGGSIARVIIFDLEYYEWVNSGVLGNFGLGCSDTCGYLGVFARIFGYFKH